MSTLRDGSVLTAIVGAIGIEVDEHLRSEAAARGIPFGAHAIDLLHDHYGVPRLPRNRKGNATGIRVEKDRIRRALRNATPAQVAALAGILDQEAVPV